MLNLDTSNEIQIVEQVEIDPRAVYKASSQELKRGSAEFELLRNNSDDTFNLQADGLLASAQSQSFNVNNKTFGSGVSSLEKYKIHSSMMGGVNFIDTQSVSEHEQVNDTQISMSMFINHFPIRKNVVLRKGQYLKLSSINHISLTIPFTGTSTSRSVDTSRITKKISYTNTYVIPRELNIEGSTHEMFDIYISNEDASSTLGDIAYEPGSMTSSGTGSLKMATSTIPFKGNEEDQFGDKKVSTIDMFDNTYYDYDKKKEVQGLSGDSQQGIFIPYSFKGEFKREFKISPNEVFKDMSVVLSNDVDQPLLDVSEGAVTMKIEDTEVAKPNWRLINSDDYERVKGEDLSLIGLSRISHEENI